MRKLLPLVMSTVLVSAAAAAPNALLSPWSGPYGGVPPFDQASPALLAPALEAGMAEHLAELDRIAKATADADAADALAATEAAAAEPASEAAPGES